MCLDRITLLVLGAFILDLLIGDPVYGCHPVRLIGNGLIAPMEKGLRRLGMATRTGGLLLVIWTVGVSVGLVLVINRLLSPWPVAFFLFNLYLVYACLAMKDLGEHVERVRAALAAGDLEQARQRLGAIVGRETDRLDEEAVARACVETLAENLSDGVIGPLFYAFLGGAPLAVLYKAVSTMDSMVGYKNDRYLQLGCVAARCDDLLNWIPARLTLLLILAAGICGGNHPIRSFRIALRDRHCHPSPNAGHPEAAMAAVLNLRLGGPSRYHGELVEKPCLNAGGNPVRMEDISSAWRISLTAGLSALFAFTVIRTLL